MIEEIENNLPQNRTLDDIPLQFNNTNNVNEIELYLYDYLGFEYCVISVS